MKRLAFLFVFLLSLLTCSAQNELIKNDTCNHLQTNHKTILEFPDSIKVLNYSNTANSNWASDNMPWIVAFLIGILSFVLNLVITNKSSNTATSNLREQIRSTKEIALTDFKAKLKTQNMQKWLDDLRDDLSEYLAYAAITRAKLAEAEIKNPIASVYDVVGDEFKMMVKYKVKLLTKLNLQIDEQKEVATKINDLFKYGFVASKDFTAKQHIELENKLLADIRKLVDIQWGEIKNIEN